MEYLLFAIILFIIIDVVIRQFFKKHYERKIKKEREEALEEGLKLDFSQEALTLKRVQVENPLAKILCVDDEEVILDSFRKILVVDGYSVDTVENGKEALNLIQNHHYDFVFTDLKMPEMDGIDVTKAVKHVRPDIDVIIITGYATVESAVETMKYGALDYVQKPFSEDELLEFAKKCLVKRKDRIKNELKPKIQLTQLTDQDQPISEEFTIPGGVFISDAHCWLNLTQEGMARIGIDDFAKKVIGHIDDVELPNIGRVIKMNQVLFTIKQGNRPIPFKTPVSGKIVKINSDLSKEIENMDLTPYGKNWICTIDADNLDNDLKNLKIGKSAISFFQEEIQNCKSHIKELWRKKDHDKEIASTNGKIIGAVEKLDDTELGNIINKFFDKTV
ncbi:MAG: response regulator [Calditrichia bacterium]|nr:response regulator [Calditrichia bacterium]